MTETILFDHAAVLVEQLQKEGGSLLVITKGDGDEQKVCVMTPVSSACLTSYRCFAAITDSNGEGNLWTRATVRACLRVAN